jgi:hypothetical protein
MSAARSIMSRVVERQQAVPALVRKVRDFVEVDTRLLTAPLGRRPGPRVIEQNIAHDPRRNSEELRPLQVNFGHVDQASIRDSRWTNVRDGNTSF